jgi:hypothetical protein
MNIFFLHPDNKNLKDNAAEHPVVHTEPARNTSEGSEFVNDAIHMYDQPLMPTEKALQQDARKMSPMDRQPFG